MMIFEEQILIFLLHYLSGKFMFAILDDPAFLSIFPFPNKNGTTSGFSKYFNLPPGEVVLILDFQRNQTNLPQSTQNKYE